MNTVTKHRYRNPKVSVLMPVRNGVETIEAAIESVISQTFKNWELVIIDDGSTDSCDAIIQAASANDSRIHIHATPPLGIVNALNIGISHCRSPWIARMDADDLMHHERLTWQISYAEKNPIISVVSGHVIHGGEQSGFAMYVDWLNSVITTEEIAIKRFIESPVAHPSVMFKRELIKRYGGYRQGDFPEDYELWLRWLDNGVKFGKVPHPVIIWNDSPTRLTRSDLRYLPVKFYEAKLGYVAKWIRENINPKREVWLWGAGRVTRKRFAPLKDHGIKISGYIDIDPNKCGHRRDHLRVVLPSEMPDMRIAFIITCVAKHGARDLIQAELESAGWREGRDFIHAA